MQSYEWNAACARSFSIGARPSLTIIEEDGIVIGLAPLVRRKKALVNRLQFPGAAELHEPVGLLFRDDAALRRICRELVVAGCPLVLPRIDREGPLPAALSGAARGHGLLLEIRAVGTPYLDLAQGWESIRAELSPRRRHDLRRARRLLERDGAVSVEIAHPDSGAVDALLEKAFDIEVRGWKGLRGSALKLQPPMADFYKDFAHRIAERGHLVMCFLSVRDTAVAVQIGVEYARAFWLLKIGYDERWAKASPGLQLLTESLRWACERGLSAYEFLGSDEPWLQVWKPRIHPCCTLVYYPYTPGGLLAFASDMTGRAWNRVTRSARAGRPRRDRRRGPPG